MRGPARVLAGGIPMEQFANMLTLLLADANGPAGHDDARLVMDETGLSGRFNRGHRAGLSHERARDRDD